MALGAGLPGTCIALILLWRGDFSSKVQWTLTLFIVGLWWGVSVALRDRVVYPLQTLSNLLAALREEDFSIRARGQRRNDPLGEVLLEMNALADTLREQRLGALEATSLLRAVMEEIPVAVFAFDPIGGCASSTAPASGCWPGPSSGSWGGPPTSSGWPSASP